MRITVVAPTHNPHAGRLRLTLAALREQTFSPALWETILVDNASTPPLAVATVVTHGLPPGSIATGVPARVVRMRS